MSYAGECTLVYTRRGHVAHLMSPLNSPNNRGDALCRNAPRWPGEWLGTGSQAEYDHAASLPLCQPCALRAAREDAYRAKRREAATP